MERDNPLVFISETKFACSIFKSSNLLKFSNRLRVLFTKLSKASNCASLSFDFAVFDGFFELIDSKFSVLLSCVTESLVLTQKTSRLRVPSVANHFPVPRLLQAYLALVPGWFDSHLKNVILLKLLSDQMP